LYDIILANILTSKLHHLREVYDNISHDFGLNIQKALSAKSVKDFDKELSIKMYNYPTADEYYRDFSCFKHIPQLKVPLFCLQAEDDPIGHKLALPIEEIKYSD